MASRRRSNHKEGKSFNALKSAVSAARSKRSALVSIHPNLHILHPMARITRSRSDSSYLELVETGAKRKRPANAAMRASLKRRKAESPQPVDEFETEEESEAEEITGSERDRDESDDDCSDEFLLYHAPKWRLHKLRKEDLLRLCALAELDDDFESLNKVEVIRLIMSTRTTLQPSRRPSRSSSPEPTTDLEQKEDKASQLAPGRKRPTTVGRRQTENFPFTRQRGMVTSRSVSLGNLSERLPTKGLPLRTRRVSAQSGQQAGAGHLAPPTTGFPSPRKTRSRARLQEFAKRQLSGTRQWLAQSVALPRSNSGEPENELSPSQSPQPSPRRLRRRDGQSTGQSSTAAAASRPRRRARFGGSFREASTDEEADELDEEDDGEEGGSASAGDATDQDEEGEEPPASLMDVDDGVSRGRRRKGPQHDAQSIPPPAEKRALRPRAAQAPTPLSDQDENEVNGTEDEDEDEDEGEEPEPEPKVLRNGKVLGETPEDECEDSSLEAEQSSMETEEVDQLDGDGDEEAEDGDEVEEDAEECERGAEDEIDIESANLKTLLRHRRDDLVRLCRANDVETDGAKTKNQLAHALLQWRDSTVHFPSSPTEPSSTDTQRDIHTRKPIPRRSQILMPPPAVPLLFRDNIHISEVPATPPISAKGKEKVDDDVEIDLESLGLTDKEIKPEKIQKLDKIGSGGFKDVYLGKYHGRKVAISEFRGQLSAMDIKELKLLREFNHPNVVKFYGVSIPADTRSTPVMIISELCPNGDLFDFVRNTPPPDLPRVLSMMRDIAHGVEYLHLRTPSIIHRDCKSSNILITSKNTAKITDFGLAKVKQSTRSMVRSLVGTVNWQAPELWHPHPKYDYKVDVFSCAMVYWEMLQWHQPKKTYPWEGMNEHAIYDIVGKKEQRPSMHGMRKLWCPEIVELIERMWAQEPRDRPTISDVVDDLNTILSKY